MPSRLRIAISLALALAVGCQQQESPQQESSGPPRELTLPPPAPPKPGDTVFIDGLTVKYLDHGAIQITGMDRWGAPINTTYENAEFLRKALPTLARGLTPAQAAGLRRQIMQ